MTTTTMILAILLGMAMLLIVRLIKNVINWRKAYYLKESSSEFQRQTIENQRDIINSYKQMLSTGIKISVKDQDKLCAN